MVANTEPKIHVYGVYSLIENRPKAYIGPNYSANPPIPGIGMSGGGQIEHLAETIGKYIDLGYKLIIGVDANDRIRNLNRDHKKKLDKLLLERPRSKFLFVWGTYDGIPIQGEQTPTGIIAQRVPHFQEGLTDIHCLSTRNGEDPEGMDKYIQRAVKEGYQVILGVNPNAQDLPLSDGQLRFLRDRLGLEPFTNNTQLFLSL